MQGNMSDDCRPAHKKSIRAWYDKGTLCILAEVEVPSPCDRADILRSPLAVEPPHFYLQQCRIPSLVCTQVLTTLTICRLFPVGSFREHVIVSHAGGDENVPVERVAESARATKLSLAGNEVPVPFLLPPSLASIETSVEAVGYSDDRSFNEALENAIAALPPGHDTYPDELVKIIVVEIGVELGGFPGFNHLYVRVRRVKGK